MRLRFMMVLVFASVGLFGGEWVLPWVSDKGGEWASEVVLNNLSAEATSVDLEAVRPGGQRMSLTVTVPASGQMVLNAAETFTDLGAQGGFTVFISTTGESLSAAARVASLQTASKFSPSMGAAIPVAHSAQTLVFPTMPADGFSAPVVVNLADSATSVSITAHTAAGQLGEPVTIEIPACEPWAGVVTSLFPELGEGAFLIATATGPITGANFSFNSLLEPSMINAVPHTDVQAEIIEPMLVGLETAGALAGAVNAGSSSFYGSNKKMDCPEVTSEINLTDPTHFLTGSLNWGDGCTNAAGVFHSGMISFVLARQGSLTETSWLSGEVELDQFVTQYQEGNVTIDGSASAQVSTISPSFTLAADLSVSGNAPMFETSGSASIDTFLTATAEGDTITGYGTLTAEVDTLYQYQISGTVSSSDPMIYQIDSCPWPVSGRLSFSVFRSGLPFIGYLDFGTGSCTTAVLSLNGITQTLDLNDYL